MKRYKIIFGKTIYKKLKKISKQKDIKELLSKSFDKIEEKGPKAGKLLDPVLNLYEIKYKKPPLRIYYNILFEGNSALIIDFEMKKSDKNQQNIIRRIINYLKKKKSKS